MNEESKKDASFVVRISKEELSEFNHNLKKNAVNRSELFRKWIREYNQGERG